jgi:hypothetical protein
MRSKSWNQIAIGANLPDLNGVWVSKLACKSFIDENGTRL